MHPPVELKLLGDDPEGGGTLMEAGSSMETADGLFEDFVPYGVDMVRERLGLHRDLILLRLGVFPTVALIQGFFFGQGEVLLGDRFVIRKGREFGRKELAVFVYSPLLIDIRHSHHMLLDTRDEGLILLLRVLLVQDAVRFVLGPIQPKT